MDISPVLGHRIHPYFITSHLPFSITKCSQSLPANSVTIKNNNNTRSKYIPKTKDYNSISHQSRQSAMLDIQQSKDLQLALSR